MFRNFSWIGGFTSKTRLQVFLPLRFLLNCPAPWKEKWDYMWAEVDSDYRSCSERFFSILQFPPSLRHQHFQFQFYVERANTSMNS